MPLQKGGIRRKNKGVHVMKSSARDKVEGTLHQAKGKIKKAIGDATGDQPLQDEGTIEHAQGKVQEKVGDIKKVVGK